MKGLTDYRMAKRALVRKVSQGAVSVNDVCDAHPDLLRAARNIGTPSERQCPICELADRRAEIPMDENSSLRLVTYVFGPELRRKSGIPVWTREDLLDLASDHRSFMAYTVECCLVCGWNHLHESVLMGRAHEA